MRGTLQKREKHLVGLSNRLDSLQASLSAQLSDETIHERNLPGKCLASLGTSCHYTESMAYLGLNVPSE
ncbi:hypothetical protein [Hyalangium versicolor]|uniref:hypothetical protein n=1 Tax=Hyalangium versicolor TaxID=2861190 RepID=UPI001CC9A076|nr:hypothetical protein [Hyalangium versicolor]